MLGMSIRNKNPRSQETTKVVVTENNLRKTIQKIPVDRVWIGYLEHELNTLDECIAQMESTNKKQQEQIHLLMQSPPPVQKDAFFPDVFEFPLMLQDNL